MTRTLTINITLDDFDKTIVADVSEPESGENSRIVAPLSPDEHTEFNERIGNEIYSWITLWADEMEEE